ncbi:MAG TPA: hypothetical protein VII72_10730 [Myxococcota bacterium]|jgi:hypothetical protein
MRALRSAWFSTTAALLVFAGAEPASPNGGSSGAHDALALLGAQAVTPRDHAVAFSQSQFVFDAGRMLDSDWGQVEADVGKLRRMVGDAGGYLNVALYASARGEPAWIVENLRIPPDPTCRGDGVTLDQARAEGIKHPNRSVPMSAHFDLRPGTEGSGRVDRILASVLLSEAPLPAVERIWRLVREIPPVAFPVSPELNDAEGNLAEGGTSLPPSSGPLLLGPPPQPIFPVPEPPSDLAFPIEITQYDQPNIQTAKNQCMPMALANVIGYLRIRYNHPPLAWPLPHFASPGIGEQVTVGDVISWQPTPPSSRIAQIDARTRRPGVLDFETGAGSDACKYLPAVFSYFTTQGTPAQVAFRHQDGSAVYGENASCDADDVLLPLGGITSTREGPNVTWEWIFDQLQHGRGVFIGFGRFDVAGNRTGGHGIRVWGARRFDGRNYLYTLDDGDQGFNTLGLRTQQWEVADESQPGIAGIPNGRLELGSTNWEIEFAVSVQANPTLLIP